MVGVIPQGAAHVIRRNLIDIIPTVAAVDQARHVIGRRLAGNVEPVGMNVGDVGIFETLCRGLGVSYSRVFLKVRT
jgi:hypothetical protein